MTDQELKASVLAALVAVAPEANPAELRAQEPLRDQLDLDSFDFLRFIIGLHDRVGVDIPESDYRNLGTLDDSVAYLRRRLPP